jgi:heavy metal sensor kinase
MRTWSIRARLTAWFAAVLAAVLVLVSAVTWWALRDSMGDTIDGNLTTRVEAIARFLGAPGTSQSFEELREDLREYVALDPGWNLIRIRDVRGELLYRSEAFDAAAIRTSPAVAAEQPPAFDDVVMRGRPVRLLTSRILVRGQAFVVDVAWPVGEFREVMAQFSLAILLAIPAGILAAAAGGYWMSRRALAPVDRLAGAALAITASRLDQRLDVPRTGDELQRLAETLNDMLSRLEAAFSETTRFTADASHELRTPVSIIRTTAEVALRRARGGDEYREALEGILREAERTSTLVQDLLTLTRADAGVDTLRRESVDLAARLGALDTRFRALAEGRGLDLVVDVPDGALVVLGDAAGLDRLMLILVDNALKYTPAPGSVRVRLGQGEGQAVIDVEDTGIGIAAADQPQVFDRFFRADKARSRDAGGAGLGLPIARWIAERHGGRITIHSGAGEGCRVRVDLPLASGSS